ncbi:MAG TPA: universal stress protein [Puia sp.]|nr:universal stress protein [Puia sp.]
MKKIIVAIDGYKYPNSVTEYVIQFARQMNAHLVGVFLDDFTYHNYKIYDLVHSDEPVTEEKIMEYDEKDRELREESANKFESACRKAGINYSIHHDRNFAMREILHESIYADLLVIDRRETLTHYEENLPTSFIKNLLTHTECPVIVTPENVSSIKKLVLLYDGEPSSVYAIKMFSYLFSFLNNIEVEVLTVNTMTKNRHVPDNRLMKEFMKRHYPNAKYTVLTGYPDMEITNYLKHKHEDELIVLGAYRRGMISRWFKPSMADALMQELRAPLFIAHHK